MTALSGLQKTADLPTCSIVQNIPYGTDAKEFLNCKFNVLEKKGVRWEAAFFRGSSVICEEGKGLSFFKFVEGTEGGNFCPMLTYNFQKFLSFLSSRLRRGGGR